MHALQTPEQARAVLDREGKALPNLAANTA